MADDTETQTANDSALERHTEHDTGRQESLRASLEKSWEEQTGRKPEGTRDRDDEDRQRRAEPRNRPARAAKEAASTDAKNCESRDTASRADSADAASQPAALGQDGTGDAAPTAWVSAAKAEWKNLPPAVKQAVVKRESDIARGVEQLKSHYSEIDQALAPFAAAIRQHNATPGAAIQRMFQWHQYLQRDPLRGFAELAQTYGLTLQQLADATGGQQQQQPQAGGIDQRYLQQLVQQEVAPLHEAMTAQQQWVQQQQAAKTNEILSNWSRDKPFYEDVRVLMARGIESGAVPLKNGAIDLDGAYAFACAAHPQIREQLYTQRAAAERKAATDRANQARRAGASLSPTSPGSNNFAGNKKPPPGKSVRDLLHDSIDELRN